MKHPSSLLLSRNHQVIVIILTIMLILLSTVCAIAENAPRLSLSDTSLTIVNGRSAKLKPLLENVEQPNKVKYTWESSNPAIASVNNGNVQGKSGGTAIITCTAMFADQRTLAAEASITVTVPVSSIKITADKNATYYVGQSYPLHVEVQPIDATDKSLIWSVKDTSIASIDRHGVLSIRNPGKTTVTVTTADGTNKKANLSINVPSLKAGSYDVYVRNIKDNEYRIPFYGDTTYWNSNITIQGKEEHASINSRISTDTNEAILSFSPNYSGDDRITISDIKDSRSRVTLNIHVQDSAIAPQNGIIITKAGFQQNRYYLNFQVSFRNMTQRTISSVELLVDYYDTNDNQLYCYSLVDNNQLAECDYVLTTSIAPGKTDKFNYNNYAFTSDYPVGLVKFAIFSYSFTNGETVIIPDSQLLWYSSDSGYEYRQIADTPYQFPSASIIREGESFMLGFTRINLFSYISQKFAHSKYPGEMVVEVNKGSIAEKAGLYVKDVIYGVDDMLWSEEPYLIEYGKAKMNQGETITLHVIRNGMEKDIKMSKSMAFEDEATHTPSPTTIPASEAVDTQRESAPNTEINGNILEIVSAEAEKQEDGSYHINIICKNATDTMLRDVTLTLCCIDENGTITHTVNASTDAVIRANRSFAVSADIAKSTKPAAFYIDQISYTDQEGQPMKILIETVQEYSLQ